MMVAAERIEVCLEYKRVKIFLTMSICIVVVIYVNIPDKLIPVSKLMPIIQSAIKKVRKDKLKTARNRVREQALKSLIKKVKVSKAAKDLQAVYSALDKAAKVHLIHPNKSARLKSRLSRLVSPS